MWSFHRPPAVQPCFSTGGCLLGRWVGGFGRERRASKLLSLPMMGGVVFRKDEWMDGYFTGLGEIERERRGED